MICITCHREIDPIYIDVYPLGNVYVYLCPHCGYEHRYLSNELVYKDSFVCQCGRRSKTKITYKTIDENVSIIHRIEYICIYSDLHKTSR